MRPAFKNAHRDAPVDGAFCRIKDKNGETALDLVPTDDTETRALFRKAAAERSRAREEVVGA